MCWRCYLQHQSTVLHPQTLMHSPCMHTSWRTIMKNHGVANSRRYAWPHQPFVLARTNGWYARVPEERATYRAYCALCDSVQSP